jgi:hypothetical protein
VIAAHAWIENDSIPVNDSEDLIDHFAAFTGHLLTPLNPTS